MQVPVMAAHEMNYFCDEGLKTDAMSFPIDGLASGFEDMLQEKKLGELNYEVPAIKDVCAQDLVTEHTKNCGNARNWRRNTKLMKRTLHASNAPYRNQRQHRAEQQPIYEAIVESRGPVRGSFAALLHVPPAA